MSVVAMCVKCDEWDTLSCLLNHKCGSTSLLLPQELCNNGNRPLKKRKEKHNKHMTMRGHGGFDPMVI